MGLPLQTVRVPDGGGEAWQQAQLSLHTISNSSQVAENRLEVKEAFEASKCVEGFPVMCLLQQDPSLKPSETVTSHQLEIKYLNSESMGVIPVQATAVSLNYRTKGQPGLLSETLSQKKRNY